MALEMSGRWRLAWVVLEAVMAKSGLNIRPPSSGLSAKSNSWEQLEFLVTKTIFLSVPNEMFLFALLDFLGL